MNKQETDANHDQGGEITGAEGPSKQEEKRGPVCQTVQYVPL